MLGNYWNRQDFWNRQDLNLNRFGLNRSGLNRFGASSTAEKRLDAQGFTLLELLVVIGIIGVLFAIAAPGWLTYLNRQRLSSTTDKALQIVKQTQTEARTNKVPRIVLFRNSPTKNVPEFAIAPFESGRSITDYTTGSASGSLGWKTYDTSSSPTSSSNSTIVSLPASNTGAPLTTISALVFDASGVVAQAPVVPGGQLESGRTDGRILTLQAGVRNGPRRCVIVQTLVGATRVEEGTNCN